MWGLPISLQYHILFGNNEILWQYVKTIATDIHFVAIYVPYRNYGTIYGTVIKSWRYVEIIATV
jgi:hypothetical protein